MQTPQSFTKMTAEQKAFVDVHYKQLVEANKCSASQRRKVYDTFYNTIKTWSADTVLHEAHMYNCKMYHVTVEDALYSAKVNAGWDNEQVREALNNLKR